MDVLFSAREAAELADVKPAFLRLWLETGKFKTSTWAKSHSFAGTEIITYYFNEADIARLVTFAGQQGKRKRVKDGPFVDDGKQENFTVGQIASLWELSPDTIQRLFEDEPGVITLGSKNPRGKRRRLTLRIPRAVMERVKRRRSNT